VTVGIIPTMKKLSFISRIALLLGFLFTLDKLLAFVRVIIIARAFNLSFELDAFNAADILPTLLTALISGEALAVAFIPVLIQTLTLRAVKRPGICSHAWSTWRSS